MLLSSDDERKEHVPCFAEGKIEKRKGHEQISVDGQAIPVPAKNMFPTICWL